MAEYIKFRLTSAKIGVTMALAALIGGIADRAHAQSTSAAKPAPLFVKLTGITGQVRTVLAKIEDKCDVLANEIASIERKDRTDFYTKGQVGKVYMKIRSANAEFLKKADTATNSNLLGNKPASAFVQSANRSTVFTGAQTVGFADGSVRLLDIPGTTKGGIIVVCQPAPPAGGTAQVVLENNTGALLPAVQSVGGQTSSLNLKPGNTSILTLNGAASAGQVTLQLLPASGFSEVATLVVSAEPSVNGDGKTSFVAQAFTGGV